MSRITRAMLLRVRDKDVSSLSDYMKVTHTARGHFVCELPSYWQASKRELTNPDWRILLIDLDDAEVNSLVSSGVPESLTDRMTPSRLNKIDLDSLIASDARLAAYIADDTRKNASFRITLPEDILTKLSATPRLPDPNIIGEEGNIIG